VQTALDSTTGRVWSAEAYARTPQALRPHHLECDGHTATGHCRTPVHFRSASVNGRRPCFYGKHQPECTAASLASEDDDAGPGQPTVALASRVRWLMINLDPPTPSSGPDGRRRPDTDPLGEPVRRRTPAEGLTTTESTLRPRLRAILATLLATGYPPGSLVRLDGFPVLPVEAFFVRLDIAVPTAACGLRRGYYGRVRTITPDPRDGSWLIKVHDSEISIAATAAAVAGRTTAGLVGGHVLALGHPREAKRSPGRYHVKITEPALLEVQPAARAGASGLGMNRASARSQGQGQESGAGRPHSA